MPIGISFADSFGLDSDWFKKNKVLNPTIDVDTPLFIDPLLLETSAHPEFSGCAFDAYIAHFEKAYKLIATATDEKDPVWRAAMELLRYNEINGTCLGYSKKSVRGSGMGVKLSQNVLMTARRIITLGVKDVEFFSILSLFEEKIGPDRISDMTTNIILQCIINFNERVLIEIEAATGKKY